MAITRFVCATVTHHDAKGKLLVTEDVECEVIQDCGNWQIRSIRYLDEPMWSWLDSDQSAFRVAVAGIDPLWIEEQLQVQREEAEAA